VTGSRLPLTPGDARRVAEAAMEYARANADDSPERMPAFRRLLDLLHGPEHAEVPPLTIDLGRVSYIEFARMQGGGVAADLHTVEGLGVRLPITHETAPVVRQRLMYLLGACGTVDGRRYEMVEEERSDPAGALVYWQDEPAEESTR
jgi:hypothetical protein